MKIPSLITTAVVAVAVGFASPVSAQHRRGDGQGSNRGGGENRGSSAQRAVPRAAPAPAPAPRAESQQRRSDGGQRPQRYENNNNWRGSAPRVQQAPAVPRTAPPSGGAFRNDGNRYNGNNGYRYNGNGNYRSYGNSGRYYGNSGYRNYGSRNYSYRGGYYRPPVRFYHPYYSFRPRFSIGFGLWAGYPVPYAYGYYDPFYYGYPSYPSTVYPSNPYPAYPPSTVYPQSPYPPSDDSQSNYPPSNYPGSAYPDTVPDPNSIGVQPGQANTGGLSFDITPISAEIVVDGNYVGTVGEFSPSSQPLGLPAGRHRVEIQAPGYRTISIDVDIAAGQVLPYQGTMERR